MEALAARRELPFVRIEHGLTVLYLAGERPYVVDLHSEAPAERAALVERDGLDRALLCLSSPLGVEWLPHEQSRGLIDAYHDGALSAAEPFGVWGAIALQRADPDDVDRALERGCVGVSLPAGALASVEAIARLREVLARLELRGVPLFVHPGPGAATGTPRVIGGASFEDPLWWAALTSYVAGMHAAWLAFVAAGRARHPTLRVVFSMLAGLAPLHAERLVCRGGPSPSLRDPLTFYDVSSYGPGAIHAIEDVVGAGQLLYGSDRPVVDPDALGMPAGLDWDAAIDGTRRALDVPKVALAR